MREKALQPGFRRDISLRRERRACLRSLIEPGAMRMFQEKDTESISNSFSPTIRH